jgi:uncharacterized protein YcbK (DUF882 family)
MKYFTINELCRSTKAEKLGIKNIPGEVELKNLALLVDKVLDPLRRAWGKPITVTSGYRCQALNSAVGGVKKSEHLQGRAADIVVGSKADNKRLADLAVRLKLPFRQLIIEKGGEWIHISYSESDIKRQVLYT